MTAVPRTVTTHMIFKDDCSFELSSAKSAISCYNSATFSKSVGHFSTCLFISPIRRNAGYVYFGGTIIEYRKRDRHTISEAIR
jgi:hypothetical protein